MSNEPKCGIDNAGDDFQNYLNQQLKDPDFQKEWEALETENVTIQAKNESQTNK